MNEKIKKLISETPLRYNEHQNLEFRNLELEKFAELIIKECSKIAMDNLSCPASAIKGHFGVE